MVVFILQIVSLAYFCQGVPVSVVGKVVEQSRLYFKFPLKTFSEPFASSDGGNHPDHFWLQVAPGACGLDGVVSMNATAITDYGNKHTSNCFNLENGVISFSQRLSYPLLSGPTVIEEDRVPSSSSDYKESLEYLKTIASLFVRGFPSARTEPEPELHVVVEYLSSIIRVQVV